MCLKVLEAEKSNIKVPVGQFLMSTLFLVFNNHFIALYSHGRKSGDESDRDYQEVLSHFFCIGHYAIMRYPSSWLNYLPKPPFKNIITLEMNISFFYPT